MNCYHNLKPFFMLAVLFPACGMVPMQEDPERNTHLHGLDLKNTLGMTLSLPADQYSQFEQESVLRHILQRLSALPGVSSAAAIDVLPANVRCQSRTISREPVAGGGSADSVCYNVVAPDYFRVVRIPLLKGRSFADFDTSKSPPVAIICESIARQLFPDEDPIGKRISVADEQRTNGWLEVVGVVGDVKDDSGMIRAGIYTAYSQNPSLTFNLLLRTNSEPKNLLKIVRKELQVIDKAISVTNVQAVSR